MSARLDPTVSNDLFSACPADVRERIARVRLACFDVDGTLTDGRLFFDDEGRELKAFHVADGQGLVLLRKAGLQLAFVTARSGRIAGQRAAELGIAAHIGIADKLACVRAIAAEHGIAMDEVAFMGDDLPDLRVMRHVGVAVAPANAHPWLHGHVHWQTRARGGEGAVREFCDLLLTVQGHAERMLAALLAPEPAP